MKLADKFTLIELIIAKHIEKDDYIKSIGDASEFVVTNKYSTISDEMNDRLMKIVLGDALDEDVGYFLYEVLGTSHVGNVIFDGVEYTFTTPKQFLKYLKAVHHE